MDQKVYASGPPDVEMQNPCEFNEYPEVCNIPRTHTNHCLGQTLPADPLRIANRLILLFWPLHQLNFRSLAACARSQTVAECTQPFTNIDDRIFRTASLSYK
jgi:hypothetical protein